MIKVVFVNVDWEVLIGFYLIGGICYIDFKKSFIYGCRGIFGLNIGGVIVVLIVVFDGLKGIFFGDCVDWCGVIQYCWLEQLMIYVQVFIGFKSGGVNLCFFFFVQVLFFGLEKLIVYEVGFKSDLFDCWLWLNVSGFVNKYDDILVIVVSCLLFGVVVMLCVLLFNVGKVMVWGGEVELMFCLVKGFVIDVLFVYFYFKYMLILVVVVSLGIGCEDKGQYILFWQWSIGV